MKETIRRLLSPEDVSKWLGVPIPTLYSWRVRGEGPPALRVGKHLRWDRDDLEAWIAERKDEDRAE